MKLSVNSLTSDFNEKLSYQIIHLDKLEPTELNLGDKSAIIAELLSSPSSTVRAYKTIITYFERDLPPLFLILAHAPPGAGKCRPVLGQTLAVPEPKATFLLLVKLV